MLQHLSIQNFTLIQQLDLEFNAGMTVLTGETGAGKSILIDALLLTLGGRADSKVIQSGCDRCAISASFDIHNLPLAREWLQTHELANENDCILRRTITVDGRSRGFINSQPVPVQLLRELGDILVSIHGQHEHQTLLKPEQQRVLFDAYAGHDALVKKIQQIYGQWRKSQEELLDLKTQYEHRQARLDLLKFQVEEFKQLNLQENELTKIDQEHSQLAHAESLLESAQQTILLLTEQEETNVLSLLYKVQSVLLPKKGIDEKLDSATDLLNNATIQIEEAAADLNHLCNRVHLDPNRLLIIEQRMSLIHDLARKHRVKPEQLISLEQQLQQELEQLLNSDSHLQKLENALVELANTYTTTAKELTASRHAAAQRLAPAIEKYLHQLGMPGGRFTVHFETHSQDNFTPFGAERIEFQVSANPGQALQPLAKVASGGELSRISLAIHTLTAENEKIPTLIFDEVDVGIGGGTAEIVGRLLKKLSHSAQVLCVTHLPQVAAQGEHHFQVGKTINNDMTYTEVKSLDKKAKIQEIARMLGGVKITDQTLAHAKEMVEIS